MSRLEINKNQTNFLRDGKCFFYLADTVWSAFTNVSIEEWEFYLEKRWQEGFNVLQINTLPQWDRCMGDLCIYPFATLDGLKFDFSSWNEAYYDKARKMCQMAVDKGFELALVVLWLNYVPGTWGSRMSDLNIMPRDFVSTYVNKVADEFDEFNPIYIISGDTDFDTPEAIDYYEEALDILCRRSPDTLKTFHIKRGYDVIPEQYLNRIDFYMFQSGHNADGQDMAYLLPQQILKKYPVKPIINAEPCYEQMGFSRNRYGRFQAQDVRKAAWTSILSGACAGVTYGAHGVWNWKKLYKKNNLLLGEGFDDAFPVGDALQFKGAWDYGFIRNFLEMHGITELISAQELLVEKSPEIRMAKTPDEKYLIYMPYTTNLEFTRSFAAYEAMAVDLENRRFARVHLDETQAKDHCKLHMNPFEKDALIILKK